MDAILRSGRACAVVLAGLFAQAAAAQSDPGTDARLPVGANRVEIEGGYKFDYVAGRESEGWYKLQYLGTPVALRGTPSQYSDTIVLDRPKVEPGVADRSDLSLRIEEGTLAVGSGLVDLEGVRSIPLAGLEKLDLRGTAFVASDTRFKQVNAAVGLETPSLHVPGLGKHQIANWLVLGVNGQHRESTDDSSGDVSFVAATYRFFIGRAWWRAKPASDRGIAELARRVTDAFLKIAPTYQTAVAADQHNQASVPDVGQRAEMTNRFSAAVEEADRSIQFLEAKVGRKATPTEMNGAWTKAVADMARGYAITNSEERSFALYAEFSGWYEFRGSETEGRQKNLFTVSADYWFMPSRDDVFLRLRYENGYERGAPGEKKDQLLASIAFKF